VLFSFLQNKLKGWQTALGGYKPLAETGGYPGKDEIADGLLQVKKLLASDNSFKFIEIFNGQKSDLLVLADKFRDLEQFYEHQKPTWEKLQKAYDKFQLNQLELERDEQAGPALKRMGDILGSASPYGLIKEADNLISKVAATSLALVSERRGEATKKINEYIAALIKDIDAVGGDSALRTACVKPLESLRSRAQTEDSLAHITQIETEALKAFDAAGVRIEEFARKAAAKANETSTKPQPIQPVLRKKRVVEPTKLVKAGYLETSADVDEFLNSLRKELENAIANNERVEIR